MPRSVDQIVSVLYLRRWRLLRGVWGGTTRTVVVFLEALAALWIVVAVLFTLANGRCYIEPGATEVRRPDFRLVIGIFSLNTLGLVLWSFFPFVAFEAEADEFLWPLWGLNGAVFVARHTLNVLFALADFAAVMAFNDAFPDALCGLGGPGVGVAGVTLVFESFMWLVVVPAFVWQARLAYEFHNEDKTYLSMNDNCYVGYDDSIGLPSGVRMKPVLSEYIPPEQAPDLPERRAPDLPYRPPTLEDLRPRRSNTLRTQDNSFLSVDSSAKRMRALSKLSESRGQQSFLPSRTQNTSQHLDPLERLLSSIKGSGSRENTPTGASGSRAFATAGNSRNNRDSSMLNGDGGTDGSKRDTLSFLLDDLIDPLAPTATASTSGMSTNGSTNGGGRRPPRPPPDTPQDSEYGSVQSDAPPPPRRPSRLRMPPPTSSGSGATGKGSSSRGGDTHIGISPARSSAITGEPRSRNTSDSSGKPAGKGGSSGGTSSRNTRVGTDSSVATTVLQRASYNTAEERYKTDEGIVVLVDGVALHRQKSGRIKYVAQSEDAFEPSEEENVVGPGGSDEEGTVEPARPVLRGSDLIPTRTGPHGLSSSMVRDIKELENLVDQMPSHNKLESFGVDEED